MRQRDIFRFWSPLFFSVLLMGVEGPMISAAVNRLPNEVLMLGAMGIIVSLSMLIESPIINMLATSTALVKDAASYLLVRNYTIAWSILLTLVTFLVAFTPVFDLVVSRWLDVPREMSLWVKPGLQVMTLWSAAIAWRRFLQGLLVRHGQTKKVALGTCLRLTLIGTTLVVLSIWTDWPSAIVGSTALMMGVISEAIYTTIIVQPLVRQEEAGASHAASGQPLTYRELLRFHLPLGGTSVLSLLLQPVATFFLARLAMPTQSLAAWPVFYYIMLISITPALVMPESVIFLLKTRDNMPAVRRFGAILAGAVILLMSLFVVTPLSTTYLFTIQDMSDDVGRLVQSSIVFMLLYPGLALSAGYMRGLLASARSTKYINLGMAVNLSTLVVILSMGGSWRLPGLTLAAVAMNGALVAELLLLGVVTSRNLPAFMRPLRFAEEKTGP